MATKLVITFGRCDGTAVKHLYPHTRIEAMQMANALSFVFFQQHRFKPSECHEAKREENDEFFVTVDKRRNKQSLQ